MPANQQFWRLLSDYERLTQNEAAALGTEDFEEVASIHMRKDSLLERMQSLASEAGLNRENEELGRRVEALLAKQARNKALIDEMLVRADAERQNIEGARHRLRGLGTHYKPAAILRAAFLERV
jgi:hypothetical protein